MDEVAEVDIVVIGGGVVGCAAALRLSEKFSGQHIVLLEGGPRIAEGVTSRNSGVIHGGIYYPPNSLKAQTCNRGNALLYEWAGRHSVPFKKCGKLIVARGERQIEVLEKLRSNAIESGAKDIEMLGPAQIEKREPALSGNLAMWSPWTGIIDPAELSRSFVKSAQANGVILMTNYLVTGIGRQSDRYLIDSPSGRISTRAVVNAAGLHADEVSKMVGVDKYVIYPCRGDYFTLKTTARFNSLVYPVKEPGAAGLGVHLTMDLSGQYKVGPDFAFIDKKNDFRPAEHKLENFKIAAQNLFGPAIKFELQYDTCGIRPKLRAPTEKDEKDFVISKDLPDFINLVGIESPGLTSSLAIADKVVSLL